MNLLGRFLHLPIREKLTLAISANSALVVLLASVGFIVNDYVVMKNGVIRQMQVQASLIAHNTETAVLFKDKEYCQEMLNSLAVDPTIRSARIALLDGQEFGSYHNAARTAREGLVLRTLFETPTVNVDIRNNSHTLATLTLVGGMDEASERIKNYPVILLAGLITSLLVAFFGAKPFMPILVDPILNLTALSRRAKANQYTLRAEKAFDDEIGQLTDDFNLMLEQMRDHSDKLEALVRQRTESLALLNAVINSSADLIFVKDLDLRILLCNEHFARTLGKQPADLYGKTDLENGCSNEQVYGNPMKGTRGTEQDDRDALAGTMIRTESVFKLASGETRIFDTIKLPLRTPDDSIIGLLGISRDVTDSKLAEQLSDTNRNKDEFLAMLGHELRNPLAAMMSATQLLEQKQPDTPEQFHWICGTIQRQGTRLTYLVNELLDAARLTQGKVAIKRTRLDLRDVIASAEETSRMLIEERKHTLTLAQPNEAIEVEGDARRLEQVVDNLLNNAAKYTPPGGQIWLSLARKKNDAVIRVRDSGMGIPAELLPTIFQLFVQGNREVGGLGIGLALVKNLIDLHDGTVEANSQGVGQGSEFIVRLPLPPDSAARVVTQKDAEQTGKTGLRILVVDDNDDAATATALLLEFSGHYSKVALSGKEALEILQNEPFNVVILDIGMPDLSGYDVARKIRKELGLDQIKLIALSGYGQESDRQEAMNAGFDRHIVKPVEIQELEKILEDLQV